MVQRAIMADCVKYR